MDIPLHVTATDIDTMRRAVLLDPGDDVARLAFADACEEAGLMANARFVRNWVSLPGKRLLDVEAGRESWWDATGRGVRGSEDRHDLIVPPGCHRATWCRGFVEAVALSLAAFMEHAEALFRAHPITAVRLTDREPNDVSTAGRGVLYAWLTWSWDYMKAVLIPGGTSRPYDVPHELFGDDPSKWPYFDTPELAHAALSAACVAYGRRKAGLPPLPVHPRYEHAGEMDR